MDSKKLAFSDQLLSSRRKVVSGFGLGVGVSFIVLAVFLLSNSLKTPIVSPLFQGFNNVSVKNSTRVVSWPSSFSNSPSNATTTTTPDNKQEKRSADLVEKSREANASKSRVTNVQGMVLGMGNLGNLTDKVDEGRAQQRTHEANESVVTQNGNFSDSNVEGVILEMTLLGNSSEMANNNGSLIGEKGQISGNSSFVPKQDAEDPKGAIERKFVNNSSEVNSNVTDNKNVTDLSNDGGHSAEKNNMTISHYDFQPMKMQKNSYEKCDIYDGRWVRDNTKPYYRAGSCPHIDRDFNCHLNGRPDDGFVKWKWQPNGCDMPSLNATDFLERLRGKKLVFVGDSLNRNMWESLVCILRHSVRNKKRVYEISGRTAFKKKGVYAFHFEDYNCTVDFVVSPFLVRESSFRSKNGPIETLRLDLMDRTTSMYHDADVIVFNTGHWWTHEKTSKGEDYYQEGNYVHPRLKVLEAYTRAITTWARWVDKNIDSHRTQVFFRGYSVTHFRGGQWNSGGQCHKETEPIFNETYLAKYPSKMRALDYLLKEMKTPIVYMNISRLTDFRKDGHPSIYRMKYKTAEERTAAEHAQDCSHWCLPGVPDTWNELLYASLLKTGRGSWKN
ncbi:hypothetical protein Ddye_031324 [Dipteronia dyeriana]|uniref:Trichome birefringence-like N-terminal domain-containing protein n=1 Tax=Dipteronia dyeriana TaxID=168575 RepID=A0AAD9TI64_9ROSI|nr:hypothetical protein Ddye_031324 [Dipteronia dyeriana]